MNMACKYASNVKYISAQDQRPKVQLSDKSKRTCIEMYRRKGQEYFLPSKAYMKIKPQHRPYVRSQIPALTPGERARLKKAAKVVTAEERLEALARQEELTRLRNEQGERAQKYFRKKDEERARKAAEMAALQDDDDDVFGNSEKQAKLEAAFLAKQDQEEEVQAVNRYILNAKCQAMRDLQIKDKREYEHKQYEEKIRLEKMVMEENAKALAQEDTFAYAKKERDAKYAAEIRQQLLQHQTLRLMEAERVEEEGRIFREANAARQREEERLAQIDRERRAKFRSELDRIVEVSNLFKKMLYEQECEADRRVAKYMQEKRAREEQLKREKEIARQNLERKKEILYQLAKKLMSSKSNREELNLLREQERAERDYRRKEKESAILRKKLEDDVKECRRRQMEETKVRQALQIAREEQGFNEMIADLQRQEEATKKEEEDREKRRLRYHAAITKQMKDKAEIQRRRLENNRKEIGVWREAERQRLANVRTVVNAKLSAMRDACLPEHYIRDIERLMDRIIKRKKN